MTDDEQGAATGWQGDVAHLIEIGRDREAAALAADRLSRPTRGAPMDPRDQFDQLMPLLRDLVATLTPEQLAAPTACSEFTVEGVLAHMIGGATAFAAAFTGTGAPTAIADADGSKIAEFPVAMSGLQAALRSPGALDRTISAPFGDVPGEAFARFVVLDGLIHGWDLATATGQAYAPTEQLVGDVDGFARAAITPELRASGAFAPAVDVPVGASPLARLVGFTGREVAKP